MRGDAKVFFPRLHLTLVESELQKVNIVRLNKASRVFSEAFLIGSVQTYGDDFIDGFFPFNKVGDYSSAVGCVPSVLSQVAVRMSCSPFEARKPPDQYSL